MIIFQVCPAYLISLSFHFLKQNIFNNNYYYKRPLLSCPISADCFLSIILSLVKMLFHSFYDSCLFFFLKLFLFKVAVIFKYFYYDNVVGLMFFCFVSFYCLLAGIFSIFFFFLFSHFLYFFLYVCMCL